MAIPLFAQPQNIVYCKWRAFQRKGTNQVLILPHIINEKNSPEEFSQETCSLLYTKSALEKCKHKVLLAARQTSRKAAAW